jgi:hypothetical protein
MKVRMLESRRGAIGGVIIREFHKEQEYSIPDESLARSFIRNGFAEIVEEPPPDPVFEPIARVKSGRKRARRKAARTRETKES